MTEAPPPRGLWGLIQLLDRASDFRRLFFATVISLLGDWFAFVAVSGMVTEMTGQKGMPALVYAASVLPVFVMSPIAGYVGDRVDRKKLLVLVDLLRIPPALGLVAAIHWQSPWLAVACVALIAALSAFFEPISEAVLANLVDAKDLPLAQASMGTVWGSMLFVGAALGGLFSATMGREASFVVNAASFGVSALLVLRIRQPTQEALPSQPLGLGAALGEVWKEARQRLVTRALLTSKACIGVGNGIVGLLPAFVAVRYEGGDGTVGMLLAARGAGALLGPLLVQRWVQRNSKRLFLVCGSCMVLYGAAYAVLPLTTSLPLAAACIVLAHLGGGAQWSLSTYGLQATTRDRMRGRVLSLDFGLAMLSIGVSSLVGGGLADVVGLDRTTWGLAAVTMVLGVVWLGWTRSLWGEREKTPSKEQT